MNIELTTHSEEETIKLGEGLGAMFSGGEVVCLRGDLGAGKTCLVKGIARSLGVLDIVTSSSFVIASTYEGRLKLNHLDFYRLQIAEDFYSIGFDDYVSPESVTVVEWADRFVDLIPPPFLDIEIRIVDEASRIFYLSVKGDSPPLRKIISELKTQL